MSKWQIRILKKTWQTAAPMWCESLQSVLTNHWLQYELPGKKSRDDSEVIDLASSSDEEEPQNTPIQKAVPNKASPSIRFV